MQEKAIEKAAKRGKNAVGFTGNRVGLNDILLKFLKIKKVRHGKSRKRS